MARPCRRSLEDAEDRRAHNLVDTMSTNSLSEVGKSPRISSQFLFGLLLTLFSVCLAAGCRKGSATGSSQPAVHANENASSVKNSTEPIDKGDLKLSYKPRKNPSTTHIVGSNQQALEQLIANLNEKIALPWDIVVSFEDCDTPDAFYDPETRKLTLCYQMIDEYYDLFGRKIKDKGKLDDAVRGAVASTFFHELGHGLVDAWKVPITSLTFLRYRGNSGRSGNN